MPPKRISTDSGVSNHSQSQVSIAPVDLRDVRMVQAGEDLRFSLEPCQTWEAATELQAHAGIAPVTERSGKAIWVHHRLACPKFLKQTFRGVTLVRARGCASPRGRSRGAARRPRLASRLHRSSLHRYEPGHRVPAMGAAMKQASSTATSVGWVLRASGVLAICVGKKANRTTGRGALVISLTSSLPELCPKAANLRE